MRKSSGIKIENVSPKYGIDLELSTESGYAVKKQLGPLEKSVILLGPNAGAGVAQLNFARSSDSFGSGSSFGTWSGLVPIKLRSTLRIDPEKNEVSYNDVQFPHLHPNKSTYIIWGLVLLLIIFVILYFLM